MFGNLSSFPYPQPQTTFIHRILPLSLPLTTSSPTPSRYPLPSFFTLPSPPLSGSLHESSTARFTHGHTHTTRLNWALEWSDIMKYYTMYQEIMEHWTATLPTGANMMMICDLYLLLLLLLLFWLIMYR